MTDPGLDNRLRQHGRRAGLMVGLTMALTIIICVGGATLIYALLVPIFSDLIPVGAPSSAQTVEQAPADGEDAPAAAPEPTRPPAADAGAAAPAPTTAPSATEEPFEPTHQSNSGESINFRSSPGVTPDNSNLLFALPPATPLLYLDERESVNNEPWMRFRNQAGEEGWIREIDAEPYDANA